MNMMGHFNVSVMKILGPKTLSTIIDQYVMWGLWRGDESKKPFNKLIELIIPVHMALEGRIDKWYL